MLAVASVISHAQRVRRTIGRGRRAVGRWRFERRLKPAGDFALNRQVHAAAVQLAGRTVELYFRKDTIDEDLLNMIVTENSEYRLPDVVKPKVVFDVGANIGMASVYFAMSYPQAEVYCFEPLPANLELLRANVRPFGRRVHVLPYGLSDRSGTLPYQMSDDAANFGGGGFVNGQQATAAALRLIVKTPTQAVDELQPGPIDVFKIDTEGSEWPIVRSLPTNVRRAAAAFVGELHGENDWQLCQLLDPSHAIGIEKPYQKRCCLFRAIRRDLVN